MERKTKVQHTRKLYKNGGTGLSFRALVSKCMNAGKGGWRGWVSDRMIQAVCTKGLFGWDKPQKTIGCPTVTDYLSFEHVLAAATDCTMRKLAVYILLRNVLFNTK